MRAAALLVLLAASAHAQTPDSTAAVVTLPVSSLDVRLLHVVYDVDAPAFAGVMRGANGYAYPAFAAAGPVTALVVLARGSDYRPAARMVASEAGATVAALVLKRIVGRPRPYQALADVPPRDPHHVAGAVSDPYSFPSGHAALAFAVATSATLSDTRLAAPAYVWATAVSVARVWHGVHYPSDVLAGAVIGAGSAVVAHLLPFPEPGGGAGGTVPFRIVVPL